MNNKKKPSLLNKICGHPEIISCTLGACVSDALLIRSLLGEAPWQDLASDWQWTLYFLFLALPAASLLGCFLGMFTCWPLIRVVCSKINGAPLKTGDQVIILSGPHKGTITEVYEITRGQGGWELALVDLGVEHKERCRDIFEEYSLLRINRSEQRAAMSGSQPGESNGIKPRVLNKVCAHPETITWILGACVLYAVMICWRLGELPLPTIAPDWPPVLYFPIALIPAILLGYPLGMFIFEPLIKAVCSKINGAPLMPGDQVLILSGPHKGITTDVYETSRLQGGWELAYLDVGIECKQAFDEWSLLKIIRSESNGAMNRSHPGENN